MENLRETREISVGGHVIVLNTYITGRESRAIEQSMYDKLHLSQRNGEQEISGIKGSVIIEREDAQIKAVVVSIDGNSENIVERLLDFASEHYDEVLTEVRAVVEKKNQQTNSSQSQTT